MVNVRQAEKYCCEDISLIENYNQAVTSDEKWEVHHKLGLYFKKQWLIDNGFYYDQRAEMLVFMKRDEHNILHNTGNRHRLGKPNTEETKRKMSETHKGKHHTDETKRKMSAAQLNRTDQLKAVSQFTKEGEFIATYPSAHEAERQTGVNQGNISSCCHGRYKSAGGYVWRLDN